MYQRFQPVEVSVPFFRGEGRQHRDCFFNFLRSFIHNRFLPNNDLYVPSLRNIIREGPSCCVQTEGASPCQSCYDTETFLRRHEELSRRIKSLEAALKSIQPPREIDIPKTIERTQNVLDLYPNADPEEKNHLLKSIVQKAVYHKKKGAKPDDFTLEVFLLPIYL